MNNEVPSIIANDAQRSSFVADHAKIGNAYISNLVTPGLTNWIGEFDDTASLPQGTVDRLASTSHEELVNNVDDGSTLFEEDSVAAFPASAKEVRMVFVWNPAGPATTTHFTFKVWKRVKSTIDPFPVLWVVAGESAAFDSSSAFDVYTLVAVFDAPIAANTPIRITIQQQSGETPGNVNWSRMQGNFNAVF